MGKKPDEKQRPIYLHIDTDAKVVELAVNARMSVTKWIEQAIKAKIKKESKS